MTQPATCLAVLGTGSDVGKSVVCTALCRLFSDRGMRVAPFKAQNLSNNSGVTPDGLEMGRAQIVQAEAARLAPHVDMNPVLLKPTRTKGSQVVLLGRVWGNTTAEANPGQKANLQHHARAALDRLRHTCDLVVMEGAGSCAEVNLLDSDYVNLRMAAHADAPAILVADIDRGGVFAQIVGTLACLPQTMQEPIKGFIINRFRGDADLFHTGKEWIETRTARPVYGVLPWFDHFQIEAEDSVAIEHPERHARLEPGIPAIAVIRLPHISNFTDLAPLSHLNGLQLCYLQTPRQLDPFKAVILPGSKSTCNDLAWMQASGWAQHLKAYAANGGHVLGICGGYQMLGRHVQDPDGVEGPAGATPGLALLPVETVIHSAKTTTRTRFTWGAAQGRGYEIHMGHTRRSGGQPLFQVLSRNRIACSDGEGSLSADGRVMGTYIHGLFDAPDITRRWLAHIGLGTLPVHQMHGLPARERAYDLLAHHFSSHIDMDAIVDLL
jgi:adenosylcobyric acid synthase